MLFPQNRLSSITSMMLFRLKEDMFTFNSRNPYLSGATLLGAVRKLALEELVLIIASDLFHLIMWIFQNPVVNLLIIYLPEDRLKIFFNRYPLGLLVDHLVIHRKIHFIRWNRSETVIGKTSGCCPETDIRRTTTGK